MIRRDSKVPFYHQLYEILRHKIVRGEWHPGDILPTENDLLDTYRVSRSTVRQALDALVGEGLIYRQRGRGTFVAHPTVEQTLMRIVSFTDDMYQRGMKPSTEVLVSELVPAPEDIARQLDVEPGEELTYLERLRLADDEPMSIEASYLVHRYCPGILNDDYSKKPLRLTLEEKYNIRLVYAKQTIRAVNASRRLAGKLGIPVNAALLAIERVSYSKENIPVEFIRFYHRGDRYLLYNELRD
ncbi:MAG: GntR family transcriptional regulator [Anaerolineae bacterium]|nr:GntR family transcriptional regulator [Anaerolineae bacterium]